MYILGLNAYHGDSSACILKDGHILAAVEEERFNRVKHWAGFPEKSIEFCLKESGINLSDIDYITISRSPKANFINKVIYAITNGLAFNLVLDRLKNLVKVNSLKQKLANLYNISVSEITAEIHYIEHHRSHIASAFFASQFEDAAILSIDGFGDFKSTMTAIGKKNKIRVLDSVNYPHSLGIFYTAATQFLGFSNYGDEYKVMGLAPYGEPIYLEELNQLVQYLDNGFFKLNSKYFKHIKEGVNMNWEHGQPHINTLFTNDWQILFGKVRGKEDEIERRHIDFAASVQKFTEEAIFRMLNNLYQRTKSDNVCITGGVAQNSVFNGKILEETPFKNIYIPSASNDAGTSIGSALYLYNHILDNCRLPTIKTAYFGPKYSNKEIIDILKKSEVKFSQVSDKELFERVSEKLVSGAVIGWFQGRAEFGPRALGHRSILVDPRRLDAKDLLNEKIKRREGFRPFAPSIIKEYMGDFFEIVDDTPFMEKVYRIKEEKHSIIPAVTHVDGTGRVQTVDAKYSPRYYKLISMFMQKTGVPILLNTSFNENEPIVNSPMQALDCFLRTKMDMLVMENVIIER